MTALPTHDELEPNEATLSPVHADWWNTFEDPPGAHAEVIQGELVLSPSPSRAHQIALLALAQILSKAAPTECRVIPDLEWRFDERGIVARAPRPDLVVVPRGDNGPLVEVPLLAVEILSPSDHRPLTGQPMLRVDGKIRDYMANGLRHYLEISLDRLDATLWRLEPTNAVVLANARRNELFETDEPFRFSFRPHDLLA